MAISDAQFRLGVAATAVVLVGVITSVRFCGSVSLPPKPPPPGPTGTAGSLVAKTTGTPVVYQDFLAKDAAAAGVRVPSLDDMQKKLPHRSDDGRHVLEVGQPAIPIAGLELSIAEASGALVLDIRNTTDSALAYIIDTKPIPSISGCTQAAAIPLNVMVIAAGASVRRVECVWREGMSLVVTRVETIAVAPLSAWYVSLVPPRVVGVDDRIARAHQPPETGEKCSIVMPQAVKSGLERGQIGWRDLIDFYARHRCSTYRFPLAYRAFKADDEQTVPAVPADR